VKIAPKAAGARTTKSYHASGGHLGSKQHQHPPALPPTTQPRIRPFPVPSSPNATPPRRPRSIYRQYHKLPALLLTKAPTHRPRFLSPSELVASGGSRTAKATGIEPIIATPQRPLFAHGVVNIITRSPKPLLEGRNERNYAEGTLLDEDLAKGTTQRCRF
jgi:hypothetical protein